MNKLMKVLLSILGAIDVIFTIATPMIIAAIWISITGLDTWNSYFFYGVGLLSTIFRAIKIWWRE